MNKQLIEKTYPIIKIEDHNTDNQQKTFFFNIEDDVIKNNINVLPGQFYMLRTKLGQKPISVSHFDGKIIGFTVLKRGNVTADLLDNADVGTYIGLTGPLGNTFDLSENDENILIIGGGVGIAPVYNLAKYALDKTNIKTTALFGSRTASLSAFAQDLPRQTDRFESRFYTDDETGENHGFVTKDLEEIFSKQKFTSVYMCGPEKMMVIAAEQIRKLQPNIRIRISMERYMKCGIGLCGSCVLDDIGLRVCADGPVFDYDVLIKSKEFGKYHRDSHGVIHSF